MNLEFLVVALVVGVAVDWILQSKHQAENKTHNIWVLFEHSLYYSIFTTCITIIIVGISPGIIPVSIFFYLLVSHMIIDWRIPVKIIMCLKGLTWAEANSNEYTWLQLGIDQQLHNLVILGGAYVFF